MDRLETGGWMRAWGTWVVRVLLLLPDLLHVFWVQFAMCTKFQKSIDIDIEHPVEVELGQ